MDTADNDLIERLFDRDQSVLDAVSRKYGARCLGIALNILHSREDAEECVNDTYMKLWERVPPERPAILSAFIARITRNAALDRVRRAHTGKRGGGELPLILDELEDCVSDGGSVEQSFDRRELLRIINGFLEKQKPRTRVVFVSRYCLCESVGSIASRLGMTENSVSALLSRTRKALVACCRKEGYDL